MKKNLKLVFLIISVIITLLLTRSAKSQAIISANKVGCAQKVDSDGWSQWCNNDVCGYYKDILPINEGYSQVCLVSATTDSIDNQCPEGDINWEVSCSKTDGCTGVANYCICGNEKCPSGQTLGSPCAVVRTTGDASATVLKKYGKYTDEGQCVECSGKIKTIKLADTDGSYVRIDGSAPSLKCQGTVHGCSAHNGDKNACTTAGCTYYDQYGTCTGTHKACEWYSSSDCTSHECVYSEKCESVCGASTECDERSPGEIVNEGICDSNCQYKLVVDTGMGEPIIEPSNPEANTGFTIYCPVNKPYDCIGAYANKVGDSLVDNCYWGGWTTDNKMIGRCSGMPRGSYTAVCNAVGGTFDNCAPTQTEKIYTVGTPIDTGLGTPEIVPSDPEANTGFKIKCPTNGLQQYDCIDAYANMVDDNSVDKCSWSGWEGNKAVFDCSGRPEDNYNAICTIYPTATGCKQVTTTNPYTVTPKTIELTCGKTLSCKSGGDCDVANDKLLFKYTLNNPSTAKISIQQSSNEADWDLYADKGGEIPPTDSSADCVDDENQRAYGKDVIDSCEFPTLQSGSYYAIVKNIYKAENGDWNFDITLTCTQIPEYVINVGQKLTKTDKKAYFKFTLSSPTDVVVKVTPKYEDYDLYTKWVTDIRPLAKNADDALNDFNCSSENKDLDPEFCENNGQPTRLNPGTYYFMVNCYRGCAGEYDVNVFTPVSCPSKSCQYNTKLWGLDIVNGKFPCIINGDSHCHDGTDSDCWYMNQGEECRVDVEETDSGKDYMNKGNCTEYQGCVGGNCINYTYQDMCYSCMGTDTFNCGNLSRLSCMSNKCCMWMPSATPPYYGSCKQGFLNTLITNCMILPNCKDYSTCGCVNSPSTLIEYYSNTSANKCEYEQIDCKTKYGPDYYCSDGACKSSSVVTTTTTTTIPIQDCSSFGTGCNIACGATLNGRSTETREYFNFTLSSASDVAVTMTPKSLNVDYDLYMTYDGSEPTNATGNVPGVSCRSYNEIGLPDTCPTSGYQNLAKGTYHTMVNYYSGSGAYDISLTCSGGNTTADFIGTNFDCISISTSMYKCGFDYTNNLGEYAIVQFMYKNEQGTIVSAPLPSASPESKYVYSWFDCSSVSPGTYYVRWKAFRASDTELSNAVAWSKSYETRTITC